MHFHIALWDILGIFCGTPANYFADFGAILAIFDHFWAAFGPFLDRKKMAFFAGKWHFGPGIRAESQNRRWGKSPKWGPGADRGAAEKV